MRSGQVTNLSSRVVNDATRLKRLLHRIRTSLKLGTVKVKHEAMHWLKVCKWEVHTAYRIRHFPILGAANCSEEDDLVMAILPNQRHIKPITITWDILLQQGEVRMYIRKQRRVDLLVVELLRMTSEVGCYWLSAKLGASQVEPCEIPTWPETRVDLTSQSSIPTDWE